VSESTDALVGVYESMKDAESAVHTLLEQGVPRLVPGLEIQHPATLQHSGDGRT
jgi:hypothetical protein